MAEPDRDVLIRTLIIASQPLVRVGLEAMLAGAADISVHSTSTVDEAASDVDAVVWHGEGFPPRLPVGLVVLTEEPPGEWDGPIAWLPGAPEPAELRAAVRTVAAGLSAARPEDVAALTGGVAPAPEGDLLTPREREVLQLLAEGEPNKIIANRLSVSEHTVKFHISSIFRKLGATSRTEAVTKGLRRGLTML